MGHGVILMDCPRKPNPFYKATDFEMVSGTRYAAHLSLDAIGPVGQGKIQAAKVLVLGMGGLGCPVAQYIAGSGVGELLLCDFDTVSQSNLARQLLYSPSDEGRFKVDVAQQRLLQNNPQLNIQTHKHRVDRDFLHSVLSGFDLVIDASDNFGTRLAVNQACLETLTPWVMGSCIRFEGQVMLFDPAITDSACYRCTYGTAPDTLEDCAGAGIFAPVAGMVGTTMAQLALARLAGLKPPLCMNLLDAEKLSWRQLNTKRNANCPACAEKK